MESLNVAGMVRNRHLAKALTDAAVGGFLRELQWQCAKRGVQPAHSGDVVPKYSTMRSVRRTARRADRPVGADVSLRALRVALRPGPQRGPEPETSRPCFMGDDKRTWRRCKSGPRAGDCQRSVYWTWQSPTALSPDSGVMRRPAPSTAIMPSLAKRQWTGHRCASRTARQSSDPADRSGRRRWWSQLRTAPHLLVHP